MVATSMFFAVMSLWVETVVVMAQYSESSCTNVLLSLSPCLDYITEKASTPSSECCSQLAYVVGSQPQCLCEVVNGAASSIGAALNINQTQALELPSACRVQTPPISACSSSSGSSVSSPTGVSVTNIPNSSAGFGSNIVSSTSGVRGGGSSFHWNSSSTKLTSSYLLVLLLFATSLTFRLLTTI